MHRRIRHWSSQGFIYHLGQVDETALPAAVELAAPLRNDTSLSAELIEMDRKNTIRDPATNTIIWHALSNHLVINRVSGYAKYAEESTTGTVGRAVGLV